ncbi:MAG: DUF4910 domain-containing protein, partial [Litorivicinaceae bacterium]|nr:DUF4910 domain-containing protein [Litorivicinaceae bacterium]
VTYKVFPFDADGSDERQYSSPGFSINCVTISKDKYYEYPQYHTSLDNLDFVKASQIKQTLDIYEMLIDALEKKIIYKRSNPFCEPMLSKYDIHSHVGGAYLPENVNPPTNIVYEILARVDGNTPLDDLLDESVYEKNLIKMMMEKLESLDLIERI